MQDESHDHGHVHFVPQNTVFYVRTCRLHRRGQTEGFARISTTCPIFFRNFSQPGFVYPPDSLGRDTSCRRGGVQFRKVTGSGGEMKVQKRSSLKKNELRRFIGGFKYHQISSNIIKYLFQPSKLGSCLRLEGGLAASVQYCVAGSSGEVDGTV